MEKGEKHDGARSLYLSIATPERDGDGHGLRVAKVSQLRFFSRREDADGMARSVARLSELNAGRGAGEPVQPVRAATSDLESVDRKGGE